MTPEKNLEFFCHGIAEEIINALIGVSGLRVVALSSAFRFKSTEEDVASNRIDAERWNRARGECARRPAIGFA